MLCSSVHEIPIDKSNKSPVTNQETIQISLTQQSLNRRDSKPTNNQGRVKANIDGKDFISYTDKNYDDLVGDLTGNLRSNYCDK